MKKTTLALLLSLSAFLPAEPVTGWLDWRGPLQTGVSLEKNLPAEWTPGGKNHLWSYEVQGGGAPVIAGDRLYAFGFYGEFGEEVQETLLCLDANTGEKIWEHRFSDYLSDIVYNRYGIGSPVVDPASGNIYLQASNGRIMGFSPDGKALWERSLMEEFGRLTFPNGRTGSAAIDGRLVIFHCVTANWGAEGPGADRFYAFDKTSGELVWSSSPGTRPVDSSFSMPVFADLDGHRVFYAGTGCGNAVCVDARTGKPLWRFQISQGGVNSQLIPYGTDKLLVIHGKENMDSTNKGRIVSLKIPTSYPTEQLVLGPEAELWRNDDFVAFTSSPVLVENRLYLTNATGELACVDADSGKTLWSEKLGHDQIHASPVYGDGKLYVPFFSGLFFIVEPSDEGAKVLQKAEIKDGDSTVPLLAAPSIHGGKVFLQTRSKLHAFGKADGTFVDAPRRELQFPSKEVASLQIVPAEFALAPGATQKFKVYGLDPRGLRVQQITEGLSWEKFVPPTAKVKAKVDASLDETSGTLTAAPEAKLSAGALKVTWNGKSATTRGRVQATYGYSADFDSTPLTQKKADGTPFSFPPLPWLGARVKWSVIEKDGSKVITNNLDNILFQRTMNFFGPPDLSNYILEADVMTDGNRRVMSNVGLVNQRYLITLVGNSKILEVSSNHERVKESVPFPVKANTWYRLKTHVVAKEDGTGTVFAKAWPRGEDEPAAWTIEVPVKKAHPHGAPAIYAFSPQSLKPVFIDNIKLSQAQ